MKYAELMRKPKYIVLLNIEEFEDRRTSLFSRIQLQSSAKCLHIATKASVSPPFSCLIIQYVKEQWTR